MSRRALQVAVVAALALQAGLARAFEDVFLCADTFLLTESPDSEFRTGCSMLDNVSVGYSSAPSAGPGLPQGVLGPITLTMGVDRNFVRLAAAAAAGTEAPVPLVISWRRSGVIMGGAYATLTLEHARVSEISHSSDSGGTARGRVVLRASKITYTVRPINTDGTLGTAVTVPWEAAP